MDIGNCRQLSALVVGGKTPDTVQPKVTQETTIISFFCSSFLLGDSGRRAGGGGHRAREIRAHGAGKQRLQQGSPYKAVVVCQGNTTAFSGEPLLFVPGYEYCRAVPQ